MPGSQVLLGNRVWKEAGGTRWGGPLEGPPALLRAVEDRGSPFSASPLRSGTEPVSRTVAPVASSISGTSMAVRFEGGQEGERKGYSRARLVQDGLGRGVTRRENDGSLGKLWVSLPGASPPLPPLPPSTGGAGETAAAPSQFLAGAARLLGCLGRW